MADEIKPTGGKQPPKHIPEEFELQEIKPAKKPIAAKGLERISHAPSEVGLKKEKPIDGNNPMLPLPLTIVKEEADQICLQLEQKFTEPLSYAELVQKIVTGSEDMQTRIAKGTEEINKVLKSDVSFEAKTMQIQMILLATMNFSLEIGGEYGKFLSLQQADQKKESFDILLKQQDAERKAATTSIIAKIFGWIGEIVNLFFAALAVAATAIAAVGTAGASTALVAGAIAWISGAVLGIAARGCEESGALKNAPPWAGTLLTFAGMALSLGGMALTGGVSALKVGQDVSKMIPTAIKYFHTITTLLKVTGETTVTVYGQVVKLEIEGLRAEKVSKDKEQNQLEFSYNNMIREQQNILKSVQELSDKISSGFAQKTRSISATLGNI